MFSLEGSKKFLVIMLKRMINVALGTEDKEKHLVFDVNKKFRRD